MRVGSLFSGYGGLDMAVGGDLAWYSEIEPAACRVMEANHPGVPNLGDITKIDWIGVPPVHVLTGGYPCQPFSNAGNRKGKDDERHLWPYVRDAIREIRPRYTVLENVRGHLSLGFADVLRDCAADGLSARWCLIRAADAGAPHNRARLFIIVSDSDSLARSAAESFSGRSGKMDESGQKQRTKRSDSTSVPDSDSTSSEAWSHAGHSRERLRQQPMGHTTSSADSSSERYGSGKGSGEVASVGGSAEGSRWPASAAWEESGAGSTIDWREYEPAIRRWEAVIGRAAPSPTVRRDERKRLNPVFVEWMMGLPEGWVTGHGLSASQELKMLGNGVVPQQAALALQILGAR